MRQMLWPTYCRMLGLRVTLWAWNPFATTVFAFCLPAVRLDLLLLATNIACFWGRDDFRLRRATLPCKVVEAFPSRLARVCLSCTDCPIRACLIPELPLRFSVLVWPDPSSEAKRFSPSRRNGDDAKLTSSWYIYASTFAALIWSMMLMFCFSAVLPLAALILKNKYGGGRAEQI